LFNKINENHYSQRAYFVKHFSYVKSRQEREEGRIFILDLGKKPIYSPVERIVLTIDTFLASFLNELGL
jgi:hypothetical protein